MAKLNTFKVPKTVSSSHFILVAPNDNRYIFTNLRDDASEVPTISENLRTS